MAELNVKVEEIKEYCVAMQKHNNSIRVDFLGKGLKRVRGCSLKGKELEKVEAMCKKLEKQAEAIFEGTTRIMNNLLSFCEDIEDYNKKDIFAEVEAAAGKIKNTTKKRTNVRKR